MTKKSYYEGMLEDLYYKRMAAKSNDALVKFYDEMIAKYKRLLAEVGK